MTRANGGFPRNASSAISAVLVALLGTSPAAAAPASPLYPPNLKIADVFGRDVEIRQGGKLVPNATIADAEKAGAEARSNVTALQAIDLLKASVAPGPISCADLKALKLPWARITSTEAVPAKADAMAHCKVLVTIDKEIHLEVDLPAASGWNGKFLMGGGGGFLGDLSNAIKPAGLMRGYAVAATDTGHLIPEDAPGYSWAYQNPERVLNYGHRGTHVAQATAKMIVRAYYKRPIAHAYFYGQSGSGRQAMMEAQRYPDDFDGIVAACATLSSTRGSGVAKAWTQQQMFPTLEDAVQYRPVVRPEQVRLLDDTVYAKCDGVDGLVDGGIENPMACKFDPQRDLPRCADDRDGPACFTARQIDVIDRIHKGPSNAEGQVWPGMPYGGALAGGQWTEASGGYVVGSPQANKNPSIRPYFTRNYFQANETLKYLIYGDPNYDLHSFNFETDIPDLEVAATHTDAVDPDLSGFQRRGGKLLTYIGWSDWSINPLSHIDYYQRVAARMGGYDKVADFSRLFLLPGNGHCNSIDTARKTPYVVDFLTELEGWVEQGKTPERIIAAHYADPKVVRGASMPVAAAPDRTRPLCLYPRVARYTGSGSVDDASNFVCRAP